MKVGDLVLVHGIAPMIDDDGAVQNDGCVGIVLKLFVKDKTALVLFPSIGKQYVNLYSLKLLNENKNEKSK